MKQLSMNRAIVIMKQDEKVVKFYELIKLFWKGFISYTE